GLIVAPGVAAIESTEEAVFDFVGVAGGERDAPGDVAGLRRKAGSVVLALRKIREVAVGRWNRVRRASEGAEAERIGRTEKVAQEVFKALADVGFRTADLMLPVRAAGKLPDEAGGEIVESVVLVEVGRLEERLAGCAGVTRIIAHRDANGVVVRETPTE